MRHPLRSKIALLLPLVPLGLLAACGDDSPAASQESRPPASSAPPATSAPGGDTTEQPDGAYQVPTGADDVVISVAHEGGFVPVEMIFANTPVAMVTGDNRVLTTGPVPAIYPGPLLPNLLQRTITPEAVQQLMAKADELGLLAEVEYPRNDQIADAPDTVVTINVNGATYEHRAYALGLDPEGGEDDPARANLLEFVNAMTDLATTVGEDQLGPEEAYDAETYLIRATPADPEAAAEEGIEPTVVEWPAVAPVRLADADECAEVPVEEFEPLFRDANQLTFFTDAGPDGEPTPYRVVVVPQFPGRTC